MFKTREDAGQKLGFSLKEEGLGADIILGLPRGGVVVAAEVARILDLPLDVVIVRKIGHPLHREFAVGALAEGDVVLLDNRIPANNALLQRELEHIIREEQERVFDYSRKFHREGLPDLNSKRVILVDDGLATGATTEAAVQSVRRRNASSVVVAVPVASTNAVQRLQRVADDVRALVIDPGFEAVGGYYEYFNQASDEEVIELLDSRGQLH